MDTVSGEMGCLLEMEISEIPNVQQEVPSPKYSQLLKSIKTLQNTPKQIPIITVSQTDIGNGEIGCSASETSQVPSSQNVISPVKYTQLLKSIETLQNEPQHLPIISIIPLFKLQDTTEDECAPGQSSDDETAAISRSEYSSGYSSASDIEVLVENPSVVNKQFVGAPLFKTQIASFPPPPEHHFSQGESGYNWFNTNSQRPPSKRIKFGWDTRKNLHLDRFRSQPVAFREWSLTGTPYTSFESRPVTATHSNADQFLFRFHASAAPAPQIRKPKKLVRYRSKKLIPYFGPPATATNDDGNPVLSHQFQSGHQCLQASFPGFMLEAKTAAPPPEIPKPKKLVRYFEQQTNIVDKAVFPVLSNPFPQAFSEGFWERQTTAPARQIRKPKKLIRYFDQALTDDTSVLISKPDENSRKRKRSGATTNTSFGTWRTTREKSEPESRSPPRRKPKNEPIHLDRHPEIPLVDQKPIRFDSPQHPEKLYYYTTEEDLTCIFQQRYIGLNEMSTARNGLGVYFSELPPDNESFLIAYNNNYEHSTSVDYSRTVFCFEFLAAEIPALRFCIDNRWNFSDVQGWRPWGIWKSAVSRLYLAYTQGTYYRRELNGPGFPKRIQTLTWNLH